ncbi:L7Ae/L30e/S12e/Gadd45 family ribosomal protein [Calderihabitans maritimus]|uniref:50S ribosomal protein L7ae n=1 Tax=Calderihabitans maritimus TaxID=1246530 RepID=A0A1Z5HXR4_9FIRM|nr:ribosomal L7Ae/L30e/S12e/Gadd45 family protein [Calderihabitans maritimus]GAW94304.1 50S ribosomal protein L7ae [Calderihabitans maritimus]
MKANVKTLLGFAQRAGKIVSGRSAVLGQLKKGRAQMVILATDSASDLQGEVKSWCSGRKIPVFYAGTKVELGLAIGKSPRAVLAVLDRNFAERIEQELGREEP